MTHMRNKLLNLGKISMLIASCVAFNAYADGFGVSGTQPTANATTQSNNQSAVIEALLKRAQQPTPTAQTAAQPQVANNNANNYEFLVPNNNAATSQTTAGSQPQTVSANIPPTTNNVAVDTTTQTAPTAEAVTVDSSATAQNNANAVDPNNASTQAFSQAVRNIMPLTPDQIKALRYLFDQSQQAVATYPGVPPKPTSSSVTVNLSPGSSPPIIRLEQGYVTSLVFMDATGAAWPIAAYDLGNPKSFNIQWDQKGNTLMVQSLDHYQVGNLAVLLKGLDTPVMITLMPGQHAVDYRVDLRIPRLGPSAKPVLEGLPSTGSPQLINVLDGIPPEGSQPLKINGGDCQGWLLNNHVFLRTSLTILSPAWITTMSSSDGTNAYELPSAPVYLASSHGKILKLSIEGL